MSTDRESGDNPQGTQVIAEVGGLVDETRVTLGIHGADLNPDEISALLRCTPTSSYRRGDARRPGIPAWERGAWLFRVEGTAPRGPDELVCELLDRLSSEPAIWEELVAKYRVRVTLGIFVGAWTRGFDLSPTTLQKLAALGVPVDFDIYADGEESNE